MSNDQVRICFVGTFIGKDEAEEYQEEFFHYFGQDIDDGLLTVLENTISQINHKWVVRIMAENAQYEFDFSEWKDKDFVVEQDNKGVKAVE